jgi:hypothetical protein
MNLTELRAEVYTLTNRPDLVDQTLTAIRSATLKLHQQDFYPKDLYETGISFTDALFLQQLEYRTIIPRWRAFKYLRRTDITGTSTLNFYELIPPEASLDDYLTNRENVCYLAGSVLQIRSATQLQYALLGCYLNPNITVSGYTSWIANDHPYAIIFAAAATVFKMIGKTEEFAAYTGLANDEANHIGLSNIVATGY